MCFYTHKYIYDQNSICNTNQKCLLFNILFGVADTFFLFLSKLQETFFFESGQNGFSESETAVKSRKKRSLK